jgi:hypothetical protein
MYKNQTQSNKNRDLLKTFDAVFKSDNLNSELYKKHFKKSYAGKPTKKYLRIWNKYRKLKTYNNTKLNGLIEAPGFSF